VAQDSDDSFEWESDGEAEPSSAPASRNMDAAGLSTLVRQIVTDRKLYLSAQELIMTCYYYDLSVIFVHLPV
jgi:hypothetical protein